MARSKNPESRYVWWRIGLNIYDYKMLEMENEPGGYEFEVIYLKLMSHACEKQGYLSLPKDENGEVNYIVLSKLLRHDANILKRALRYFYEKGFLVEAEDRSEDLVIYFPELKYRVGSNTSYESDKKRYQRRLEKQGEIAGQEKLELSRPEKSSAYRGVRDNVTLTDSEYKELQERYINFNVIIDNLSIWLAKTGRQVPDHYAWCLNFGEKDGIKRPNSKEEESKKRARVYTQAKAEVSVGGSLSEEARKILNPDEIKELESMAEAALKAEREEVERNRADRAEAKKQKAAKKTESNLADILREKYGIKR